LRVSGGYREKTLVGTKYYEYAGWRTERVVRKRMCKVPFPPFLGHST
jgi:hypothetical protein